MFESIKKLVRKVTKKEDQTLKLKVRDNLLEYMNTIAKDSTNKEEAMRIASEHKNEFIQIAEKTIRENGNEYTVNIQKGNACIRYKLITIR